jgi:hypothetical protein
MLTSNFDLSENKRSPTVAGNGNVVQSRVIAALSKRPIVSVYVGGASHHTVDFDTSERRSTRFACVAPFDLERLQRKWLA